jgi:cysteine desulfurase
LPPVYLDNNATTPLDPEVKAVLFRAFEEDFGNAGSRTHEFGSRAKQAVQRARLEVADVVGAESSEVIFTSGATEANNLAILGLAGSAPAMTRRHIITTAIEHKAVLEPVEALKAQGFEVSILPVTETGQVTVETVQAILRPDTLLVSVMQANNETGVLQPVAEIADQLVDHPAYFHVDAAQGFAKSVDDLRHPRIDLISTSAHKLYGPKGVGALIARRRDYDRPPLRPLVFGGGQERGLRAGTLPVPLIVAFGAAARLAMAHRQERHDRCLGIREKALAAFARLDGRVLGEGAPVLPHVLNIAFEGVDSEALMLSLKDLVAVSNGSACTSSSYEPSHVLAAMGLPESVIASAIRLSWSHATPDVPWDAIADRISALQEC